MSLPTSGPPRATEHSLPKGVGRRSGAAACLALCAAAASVLTACAAAPGRWQLQHSATAGSAIVSQHEGREFRIACRLNPPDLYVSIAGISPRPGAVTIEISSGGHVARLPVLPTPGGRAVEAAGPVPETFLYMLNATAPFRVRYAGRGYALSGLDEPSRDAFAAACGKSAGTYEAAR